MQLRIALSFLLAAILTARAAIGIGDTYQNVIEQKGPPSGKMQSGDTVILRYPDQTIKLKADKVVAIEAVKKEVTVSPKPVLRAPVHKPAAPAQASEKPMWSTDYGAALAEAKAQNRRVFVFFTGSDWCIWCKRLNEEILSTPEFARYAEEKLVLVEIDFPHSKSQSPQLRAQNVALARQFKIRGYPTVVVLDPNGQPLGLLGYHRGGPEPFLNNLNSL